jgi:hypothetical protein
MTKERKTLKEMTAKEWNRHYNLTVVKEVTSKVIVGLGYAAVVALTTLAVGGFVMMIINNFLA